MTTNDPYADLVTKQEDPYQDLVSGEIPKTENFLQKAINVATKDFPAVAAGLTFPIPQGVRQTVGRAPLGGFTELGSQMAQGNMQQPVFDIPQATTETGQFAEKVAPFIPSGIAVAKGATAGVKGIGKLFGEKAAKKRMSDVIRTSAGKVEKGIQEVSKVANEKMSKELSQLSNTGMNQGHFKEALQQTANNIDPTGSTHSMAGSIANKVLSIKDSIQNIDNMTGPQVQSKIAEIVGNLGFNSKAQAEFYTQFGKLIPDTLKSIKASRANVYKAVEDIKPLTKLGNLGRIAKGTVGDIELEGFKSAQKNLGNLNVIEELIKSGKAVGRTKLAKGIALGAGGLTAAGGGLAFLKKLIGQ